MQHRTSHNSQYAYTPENLLNSLRLRYGLRWETTRPGASEIREHLRTAGYIAGLLAAYAVVGTIDYAVEVEQEKAALQRNVDDLTGCLSGKHYFIHDDPNPRGGFGKVAVLCKTEEIRV